MISVAQTKLEEQYTLSCFVFCHIFTFFIKAATKNTRI